MLNSPKKRYLGHGPKSIQTAKGGKKRECGKNHILYAADRT